MRKCFVYSAIMESMREAWTDERLDDLTNRMDQGFARLYTRVDKLDTRIDKFEDRVDSRFDKIDARLERFEERITSRFEWLWRMMLAGYVTAVFGFLIS